MSVSKEQATGAAQIPTLRGRRTAAALLLLGPVLMLLAELNGAAGSSAVNAAANPSGAAWGGLTQIWSVVFMILWTAVIYVVTRRTAPVASAIGAVAMVCQLVALAALTGAGTLWTVLAPWMDPARIDQVFNDHATGNIAVPVMMVMFVPGLFVALIAMSVAFWKAAWVPRAVPVMLLIVMIADVALPQDPAVFHVGVFVLLVVASAILASAVLRSGAPAPQTQQAGDRVTATGSLRYTGTL
jgi:hypothetical protein